MIGPSSNECKQEEKRKEEERKEEEEERLQRALGEERRRQEEEERKRQEEEERRRQADAARLRKTEEDRLRAVADWESARREATEAQAELDGFRDADLFRVVKLAVGAVAETPEAQTARLVGTTTAARKEHSLDYVDDWSTCMLAVLD